MGLFAPTMNVNARASYEVEYECKHVFFFDQFLPDLPRHVMVSALFAGCKDTSKHGVDVGLGFKDPDSVGGLNRKRESTKLRTMTAY